MTRIIIQSNGGQQLEVERATFDAGFFPDYWYVRDAGGGVTPVVPAYIDAEFAAAIGSPTTQTAGALRAALVSPLPTVGSLTYNGDGTIASDSDGNTYTWNTDGTPATQTKGGVTRTYHWNTDGTLASVS